MKFAPGLLSDEEQKAVREAAAKLKRESVELKPAAPPVPPKVPKPAIHPKPVVVEKDRLFETVEKETGSERNYLKVLGAVAVLVAIAGGIFFYMTLPAVGDRVKAPADLENSVRDHFLMKEKRTADTIAFYYCKDYYWARVNVETRNDIPNNPLARIPTYAARATSKGGQQWDVTAVPITSPDLDKPCQ